VKSLDPIDKVTIVGLKVIVSIISFAGTAYAETSVRISLKRKRILKAGG
jgi:hypothetical protein